MYIHTSVSSIALLVTEGFIYFHGCHRKNASQKLIPLQAY
jgi:hypothetical protein